jgi:two-component system, NarL family, nitrate/nitrite response regulator NarL
MTLAAIVDDHRLFSQSLSVALRAHGLEVIEPVLSSLDDVCALMLERRPSVVLLDRDLGPLGNAEPLIRPLADAGCAVVVVSALLDDLVEGRCLALGAAACIHKSEPFPAVLATVLEAADGQTLVSDAKRQRLVAEWQRWQAAERDRVAAFGRLTPREVSVLGLLMDGLAVRAIAQRFSVSEATVRTQVRGILVKLGVRNQLEAVALATRASWRPE